jgi:tetratricopeptide (TPR) repeat protein
MARALLEVSRGVGLRLPVALACGLALWLVASTRAAVAEDAGRPSPVDPCAAAVAEARARMSEGRLEAALEVASEAARRWPDDASAQLVLGLAALRLGQWQRSAAAYEAALQLNESSFIARIGLSDALVGLGRWSDAAAAVAPWSDMPRTPRPEAERLLRVGRARLGARAIDAGAKAYAAALERATSATATRALRGEAEDASRAPARLASEARLGLAWVALARGAPDEARRGFDALSRAPEADVRAASERGRAALGPANSLGGGVAAFAQTDPRTHALGLIGGVEAKVADVWRLGVRYRHLAGPASGGPRAPSFAQHETWAFASRATRDLTLTALAAAVAVNTRSAASPGAAPAVATREAGGGAGLALRVRAGLDWLGSASFSATTAESVAQAELGARVILGRNASLTAAARGQLAVGGPHLAGRGALRLGGPDVFVEAAGLFGRLRRPVELDAAALYCTLGHLDGRASGTVGLRLGGRLWLAASYDWEAWRDPDGAARGQHRAGLGLWVVP